MSVNLFIITKRPFKIPEFPRSPVPTTIDYVLSQVQPYKRERSDISQNVQQVNETKILDYNNSKQIMVMSVETELPLNAGKPENSARSLVVKRLVEYEEKATSPLPIPLPLPQPLIQPQDSLPVLGLSMNSFLSEEDNESPQKLT